MKTLLHVGCGPNHIQNTARGFNTPDWREVRLDIDPSVNPDLVGTMTDMGSVASQSIDAVFSSHNIEHLCPHEVPVALSEFLRVLKPEGFAVIHCPDLKSVCELVAKDLLTEPAYQSGMGPISPIDILYGHRDSMAKGNLYMAHRGGFTQKSLTQALLGSGFQTVGAVCNAFNLHAIASKKPLNGQELQDLAQQYLVRE